MRYVRTSLLSVGVVIAYCLITTLLSCEAAKVDTLKVILLTVLVVLWCIATDPNRKYLS